eukprot:scaffold9492_cov108-Isochrysis_galbana.AAC.5
MCDTPESSRRTGAATCWLAGGGSERAQRTTVETAGWQAGSAHLRCVGACADLAWSDPRFYARTYLEGRKARQQLRTPT